MNSIVPFTIALISYFLSAFLYPGKRQNIFRILGLLSQTTGLLIRTIETGHAPFTNLYESLLFFSWLIVVVYLFIERMYKVKIIGQFVILMVCFIMGYAFLLPSRYKEITPLPPALQSHWLEIHVITCFLAYASFAISFISGIIYLAKERFSKDAEILIFLDNLGGKTIRFGVLFLSLGIITGAIWANYAWGTYFSWDPKETWALITWLFYIIYLHIRATLKWQKRRFALLSIAGFIIVIFTYMGVSFLLPSLHSYM